MSEDQSNPHGKLRPSGLGAANNRGPTAEEIARGFRGLHFLNIALAGPSKINGALKEVCDLAEAALVRALKEAIAGANERAAKECERIWKEATNFRTESALTSYVQNQIGPGCAASAKAIRNLPPEHQDEGN